MFTLDSGVQLGAECDVAGSAGDSGLPSGEAAGTLPRRSSRTAVGIVVLSTIAALMGIATLGVGLWTSAGSDSVYLVDTGACPVMAGSEQAVPNASSCSVLVDHERRISGEVEPAGPNGAPARLSVVSSLPFNLPFPRLWMGLASRLFGPVSGL